MMRLSLSDTPANTVVKYFESMFIWLLSVVALEMLSLIISELSPNISLIGMDKLLISRAGMPKRYGIEYGKMETPKISTDELAGNCWALSVCPCMDVNSNSGICDSLLKKKVNSVMLFAVK